MRRIGPLVHVCRYSGLLSPEQDAGTQGERRDIARSYNVSHSTISRLERDQITQGFSFEETDNDYILCNVAGTRTGLRMLPEEFNALKVTIVLWKVRRLSRYQVAGVRSSQSWFTRLQRLLWRRMQ